MKSLGVIETRGLVAAVQAVDAACKSAGVTCFGYRKVGSGLVSVCFEGEISAIHTAIERGVVVAELIDPQGEIPDDRSSGTQRRGSPQHPQRPSAACGSCRCSPA